jgi:hypothetical protein
VTSATSAVLTEWATQQDFSDAQPVSGTMALSGDGRLVITPTEPPFSIDGCNFELYSGAFTALQGGGGLAAHR